MNVPLYFAFTCTLDAMRKLLREVLPLHRSASHASPAGGPANPSNIATVVFPAQAHPHFATSASNVGRSVSGQRERVVAIFAQDARVVLVTKMLGAVLIVVP